MGLLSVGSAQAEPQDNDFNRASEVKTQQIENINIPYVDYRYKDESSPDITGEEAVSIAQAHSGGSIVFCYLANGTKSDTKDSFHRDYDPSDGAVYNEVNEAAKRLVAEGYNVAGIVLGDSENGKDGVFVMVDGEQVAEYTSVAAGHGMFTAILESQAKKQWAFTQMVKDSLAQADQPTTNAL